MDSKKNLVQSILELNNFNPTEIEDFEKERKDTVAKVLKELNFEDLIKPHKFGSHTLPLTVEWSYIVLNFHLLRDLSSTLTRNDDILSVKESMDLKLSLHTLLVAGILKNIQPALHGYVKIPYHNPKEVLYNYEVLKYTVKGFVRCLNLKKLRMLFIPNFLQGILLGLLQISYAPLKKPLQSASEESVSVSSDQSSVTSKISEVSKESFQITDEMYNIFTRDQEYFQKVFNDLYKDIHFAIFIVEIMKLFRANTPNWLKKIISQFLTDVMKSTNGLQKITLALTDGNDDHATTWKTVEVLRKLILSCKALDDFETNLCAQLLDAVRKCKAEPKITVFEQIYINIVKSYYIEDDERCRKLFFSVMFHPFKRFTTAVHDKIMDNEDVTLDIKQAIKLIYGCFVHNSTCLPISELEPLINVIFQFYIATSNNTELQTLNNELKEIFFRYLSCKQDQMQDVFDNFLFNFPHNIYLKLRTDLTINVKNNKIVVSTNQRVIYDAEKTTTILFKLLSEEQRKLLFGYLLRCITKKDLYYSIDSNEDLLQLEENPVSLAMNRLLLVHRLLSELSKDNEVVKLLKKDPGDIIKYIQTVLATTPDDTSTVFILLMILENLVIDSTNEGLQKYKVLCEPLSTLSQNTSNTEISQACERIYKTITTESDVRTKPVPEEELSDLDKALEDIANPLLPVQGHGYMVLCKLIQKKDPEAVKMKTRLLNLFQIALRNEDSYIYLSAIQGLTALAETFTDKILEVFCEEYTDYNRRGDDKAEIRIKIGEALIRVVKILGDMTPHYKTLLLNTFLIGTKDEDNLMRASSLSNLAEVCRLLGYKLGTIISEILVCIHAIITTDKACEPRRAAIVVIRQLFCGLDKDIIPVLREDILPIYRTLKHIYLFDHDDVMKLQAQLALEELNKNMTEFVFPKIESLHVDKKIITL